MTRRAVLLFWEYTEMGPDRGAGGRTAKRCAAGGAADSGRPAGAAAGGVARPWVVCDVTRQLVLWQAA